MRKTILAALAAVIIVGSTVGIVVARAQPAPPPLAMDDPPRHPHWMDWMRSSRDEHERPGMHMLRNFALVYQQDDRKLTPPDVQKIAEAFLLWRGNHAWKVVEVAPAADGSVGFALATQEGSVIARFTMDTHSGRVTRTS